MKRRLFSVGRLPLKTSPHYYHYHYTAITITILLLLLFYYYYYLLYCYITPGWPALRLVSSCTAESPPSVSQSSPEQKPSHSRGRPARTTWSGWRWKLRLLLRPRPRRRRLFRGVSRARRRRHSGCFATGGLYIKLRRADRLASRHTISLNHRRERQRYRQRQRERERDGQAHRRRGRAAQLGGVVLGGAARPGLRRDGLLAW